MKRTIRTPKLGGVGWARFRTISLLVVQVALFIVVLIVGTVGRVSFDHGSPIVGVALYLVAVASLAGLFASARYLESRRATRSSVPALDAVVDGPIPLCSLPGSRFSRIAGARHLLAPRLELSESGLDLRWRWGRSRVAWRDISVAEPRPTSLVVRLRSGRELELDTCRLPSGWIPDTPEVAHRLRASAVAALGYNEAIASEIEQRVEERRSPYRSKAG